MKIILILGFVLLVFVERQPAIPLQKQSKNLNERCLTNIRSDTLEDKSAVATMQVDDSWRSPNYRRAVENKILEAIQKSGKQVCKSSAEMEDHVFRKATSKEEYLGYVARLILHLREMSG